MPKVNPKYYLQRKEVTLLRRCNDLKSVILGENFTEVDVRNLEVAEAQLEVIQTALKDLYGDHKDAKI